MMQMRHAYFEDFQVGQEVRTPGRTVTEADIVAFAGLSGDYSPLHTDAVYAASGPFGQRIAHGLLGLAATSGLITRLGLFEGTVLAFRGLTCTFRQPLFVGDTVCACVKVVRTRAMGGAGGGLVELDVKLYNQDDKVVQSGTWKVVMRSRSTDTKDAAQIV
jgi:acyl dehydratase